MDNGIPSSFTLATAPDAGQAIWVTSRTAHRLNRLVPVISGTRKVTYSEIVECLLDVYEAIDDADH